VSLHRGSDFDSDFDRTFRRVVKGFGVAFVLYGMTGLAVLALIAWAVIRAVLHFT
jgi:hypothetical protein